MALTVPAPAPSQANSILDFLLQMSSVKERRESRKVQERMVDIRAGELSLAEKQAGPQMAYIEQLTKDSFERTEFEYSAAMKNAKREGAVARSMGDKATARQASLTADELQFKIDELTRIKTSNPKMFETMVFADNIYKTQRGTMDAQRAQIAAANQNLDMLKFGMSQQDQMFKQKIPMYTLAGSFTDPVKQAAAISALDNNDMQGFQAIAVSASEDVKTDQARVSGEAKGLKATTPVTEMEIEKRITPDTEYGNATLSALKVAQTLGQEPPEVRRVEVLKKTGFGTLGPYGWIGPTKYQMYTRQEAVAEGFGTEWDAAGGTETTDPSIHDNAREAANKVTPSKKPDKKTTTKAAGKEITDSRGWILFISSDGIETWVDPKDRELAISRGYKLSTK